MKVLLVITNISGLHDIPYSFGLYSIAAYIESKGYETNVIAIRNELELKDFASKIRKFKPSVVGFSSVSSQFAHIKRAARIVKESDKNIITLCGGVHITLYPHSLLESDDLDYVALGCPHCSIRELRNIAALLRGRKVHANVILFVATSTVKYALALRMGLIKEIEDPGAVVVKGMCPGASIFGRFGKELGVENVGTNSSKNAHYIGAHSGGFVKTHFGNLRQCIDSAVAGKWRE